MGGAVRRRRFRVCGRRLNVRFSRIGQIPRISRALSVRFSRIGRLEWVWVCLHVSFWGIGQVECVWWVCMSDSGESDIWSMIERGLASVSPESDDWNEFGWSWVSDSPESDELAMLEMFVRRSHTAGYGCFPPFSRGFAWVWRCGLCC